MATISSAASLGLAVESRALANRRRSFFSAPVRHLQRQPHRERRKLTCRAEAPEGATAAPEKAKASSDDTIQQFLQRDYKWGFVSNIESVQIPKGLSEDTVRIISAKKQEPEWMLEFRLNAFRQWLKMQEPAWSDNHYPPIDFQVGSVSQVSEYVTVQ